MSRPARRAAKALVLVDLFNPLDFDGARKLAPDAVRAAHRCAGLAARCRRSRWPVIYANDNFGHWRSNFADVVRHCLASGGPSAAIARLMRPAPSDFSILKPRHSAFYGTPLEFLLQDLGASTLVVAGIAADNCVLYTALDAHLRDIPVWVPRDCVAAETDAWRASAIKQIERAAKAWTGPSTDPLQHGVAQAARALER
jgi:nicotinamidase-related amidase